MKIPKKICAVLATSGLEIDAQNAINIFKNWLEYLNSFGGDFWRLGARFLRAVGVFFIWVFEGLAYLIKLGLSLIS